MNPPYELLNASIGANFFTNLSLGGPCFFDATSTPPGSGAGTDFCAFPNSGFLQADPQFVNPPHGAAALALDSVQLNRHRVCDFERNL